MHTVTAGSATSCGPCRVPITISVVANTLVKGSMAVFMGRKGFGRPIALVFAAAILVGVGTAVALRMQ